MPKLNQPGLNVHYSDQGTGETLVFLHGFLEDLSMWDSIIETFSDKRCICIDLLGHGETQNSGPVHGMEDQALLVKKTLDHLQVDKALLIGHSMGGYIALAFAELYPEMTAGICLMNSSAQQDSEEKKRNRDRGIVAAELNHKTFVRVAIPNLFAPENRDVFKKEIRQISDRAVQMSKEGITAALEGMKVRPDRTHLLGKDSLPVLMVIGKKDPALDYQQLLIQANLNGVQKVIFPDGHMSHFENKSELIKALKDFANQIYR